MSNQYVRNSKSHYGFHQINSYSLPVDQVIQTADPTVPVWVLEGDDALDGAVTIGGQGEINFQKDGVYNISGYFVFSLNGASSGVRQAQITINSGKVLAQQSVPLINTAQIAAPFSVIQRQSSGDTIRTRAIQTQGIPILLIGVATNSVLHCRIDIFRLS